MNDWGDDPLNDKKLEEDAPRNVSSFLRMIRKAEGADYDTLYGGGKFKDFTDHPLEPKAIQTQYGTTTSAAGGYQFQRDTWNGLKERLKLKDFSAENQDIAALELIREAGALEDVQAGRLDEAVRKVSPIWASLPGNKSGQPTRSREFIQQAFLEQEKPQAGGEEIVTEDVWTPEDPVAVDEPWTPTDPVAKAGFWEAMAALPDTAVGMAKQIVGGAMESGAERDVGNILPGTIIGKVGEIAGAYLQGTPEERSKDPMAVKGKALAAEGVAQVQEANPGEMDFWNKYALMGGASFLVTAPALVAGLVTKSGAIPLAAAGAMARSAEYSEQRAAGVSVERAGLSADIAGQVEVYTEMLPVKYALDMIGGPVLKNMIAAILSDVGGELLNTTIMSLNAKYSKNPDITWEEYGQEMLDTLGSTMVAGPLSAGTAAVISRVPGIREPQAKPLPPPGGAPAEGVEGADNIPLTDPVTPPDPNIDLDTTVLDSDAISAGIAEIDAIDTASIGERELEESRKIVEEFDAAKNAKPIPQADLHWAQLSTAPTDVVDIAEMGATSRQAGNADNYVNPNIGDRLDRKFSMSTAPSMVGLTPRQVLPVPGVHVLGEPTADRPAELLQALVDTAEPLRVKYMPDATLVISNEQLYSDSALGWHHLAGQKQHMIVPAVLRKMKDPKAFNVNTQAGVFFNFFHEFSHALFFERLLEGVPGDLSSQMIRESRVGVVSEEAVARIPDPAVQGVIREYNEIKARIMDDTMTAQEFIDTWSGPAKRARKYLEELKVAPNDSANAIMRAVVRRAVTESRLTISEMSKKQMTEKLTQDFFSLEEYFAEQGARNAYRTKQDQMTPLGRFLERGLASLRALFGDLKAALVIAPGVKFAEWMDGLPQTGRLAEEKHHIAKSKELAGKKSTKPAKKPAPVALKPSGYTPEQNIFNTPELTRNKVFAWRSMGEKEYEKLVSGEKEYIGTKQGTKGNFLAGTPESAGQFGGKGRYLVEFGGVKIAGEEGLSVGSKADLNNVTAVWKHDGTAWIKQTVEVATAKPKAKALPKVKRVAHNVLTEQTVVERQKKLRGIVSTLIRKGDMQKGDGLHTELTDLIERKQWAEVTEILQDIGVKGIKWEINPDEIPDGAVKKPGGTWHINTVIRLAKPLSVTIYRNPAADADISKAANASASWAQGAIRNYLNKYAGTARDPLKDLEIPVLEMSWGKLWESIIVSTPAGHFGKTGLFSTLPVDKPVWEVESPRDTNLPETVRGAYYRLESFLGHVGDYLSRVPLKDLPRYGLVQAVQETVANDKLVALKAERAAKASIGQLPTYKAYPDGYQWVEYVLPEKLTEAQAKMVRKATPEEIADIMAMEDTPRGDEVAYLALNADGERVTNEFSGDLSSGATPEEAWLAGQLAQEGNIMGHCVGGACGMIVSKHAQVLSLRDEKGQPHVTVEVGQKEGWDASAVGYEDILERLSEQEKAQMFKAVGPEPEGFQSRSGYHTEEDFIWWHRAEAHPHYRRITKELTQPPMKPGTPPDIKQIKGKANLKPIDKYQPYVTDLVKTGAWGDVQELENTNLSKIGPLYYTKEELAKVATEKVVQQRGFETPEFKAWFGDWEGNPAGSSVARLGVWGVFPESVVDREIPAPPVVVFMTLARLKGGEDTFHAGPPRAVDYLESVLPEVAGDQAKVPVVLNIRNPYVVQDPQTEQPMRAELERQGYDGLVYREDLHGHVVYVVFKLDQIKIVGSRSPYSRESGVSLETDFDSSTPEGSMAGRFFNSLKNFLGDEAGGLRIAVRSTIEFGARNHLNVPQVAWLNQWVEPLQYYDAKSSEFIRDRQSLLEESDKIVTAWGGMSQRNTNYLNEVLIKEMEGKEHWFKLTAFKKKIPEAVQPVTWYRYEMSQRAIDEYKKLGVDPLDGGSGQAIAGLALRVKNDGLNLINEAEWRSAILLQTKYGANPNVVRAAAVRNKKLFDLIRSTPFFYKARFGKLMLIIREQRAIGKGYETVYQQHYTSKVDWLAAYNKAKDKAMPHQQVLHREVTDEEYVMLNVPSELLDTLASEFDLAPLQVQKLQEILMPAKQERVLNQFETNRLGVPGYSRDAMRAYAHWTSHFSSQISKMKYKKLLNGAIRDMDSMIELGEQGLPAKPETGSQAPGHELGVGTTGKLRNLRRMMAEDRDYIMNPPTEYQALRSGVSIAYLFLNVATGAINFFGQVTNLLRATTKHGTLRGEEMYLDSVYDAASVTSLKSLSKLVKNKDIPEKQAALFERAVKEGATEQSYAYNLAGVANNHLAYRFRTLKPGMVGWRKFIDLGLLSFRFTEIQTRRAGMMMSLKEQIADRTIGEEEQYQNALKETAILQGDYTLHGKIKLFRGTRGAFGGTLPLVTVFFTFAQMMLFNALGGTELGTRRAIKEQIRKGELPSSAKMSNVSWTYGYTARLWIFFFMMAGYLGMPLMENIMDLLGPIWRKLGGMKPLRQELREFVKGIVGEDMGTLLSRGMMHDVFGYDVARKVGLGRAIPGTETIASEVPKSFEAKVGDMALDFAGVPGSMLRFLSGFYYKPWDEAMLRAPGGVGNMWTAYHWSQHGVRGANDAEMSWKINPETGRREVRSLTGMDLFVKGLGANPTDVSEKREMEYGAYEAGQYWLSRRKVYLDQWDKAMVQEDEAMKKAVKIGISEFNKMLRDGGKEFYPLQITPQQLGAREMARRKAQIGTERGVSRGMTAPLQREFRRSFESSEEREAREKGQ